MYLPEKGYKRLFVVLIYVLLGAAAFYFGWKYLSIVLIPFFIAWVIAYFLQKPTAFLKRKFKIPTKLSSVVLVLLVLSVISFVLVFIFDKFFSELSSLYKYSRLNGDQISDTIKSTFDKLEASLKSFPLSSFFGTDITEKLHGVLIDGAMSIASNGVEKIPAFLSSVITLIPKLFIFVVILIFSAIYLAIDFKKVNSFILTQFNKKVERFLVEFKCIFFNVASKFIKAYILMFFITFVILLVSLALIGVKFSFIIALIISIVDLLPILGSGTILIPWSVISLILGNYTMAIEIILIYLAITFIRQMLLPRIIGDFIGLHPLASLISMFAGFAIMGIFGMFIFPLVLVILKIMNDRGTIHLWKMPENESSSPNEASAPKN